MNKQFCIAIEKPDGLYTLYFSVPYIEVLEALQGYPGGLRINFSKSNGIYICFNNASRCVDKSKKHKTISDAFDDFISNVPRWRRDVDFYKLMKPLAYKENVMKRVGRS